MIRIMVINLLLVKSLKNIYIEDKKVIDYQLFFPWRPAVKTYNLKGNAIFLLKIGSKTFKMGINTKK